MTLIPSPPSILGGVDTHPGLAPTSFDQMMINGYAGASADLAGLITDATIDFIIDGTSTMSLVINDNHLTFLNSPLAKWLSWVFVDGVGFVFSAIQKTGKSLTLTFDHEIVQHLNSFDTPIAFAAGTLTRTGFCRKLASSAPWINVLTPAGESIGLVQQQLTVGNIDASTGEAAPLNVSTVMERPEGYYDAMGRVLDEIGWRRFPVGHDQLLLVPDEWLFAQAPLYVLDESSPGVDSIDFEWDSRQPLTQATINCRAEAWAWPVGSVVALGPAMGIAAGNWLVYEIARSLLSPNAVVTLQKPLPIISEQIAEGITIGTSSADMLASAPSNQAVSAVAYANKQIGDPYQWGGDTPSGFDCSGLVQASYARAGINLPRVAQAQFDAGPKVNGPLLPGDLVFFGSSASNVTHVGIYIGNNQMIDAPHTGANVRIDTFSPVIGAAWGSDIYVGATRPAPAPVQPPGSAITGVNAGGVPTPPGAQEQANQVMAQQLCANVGWVGSQWIAFNNIVMAESKYVINARSGESPGPPDGRAYGIPQALPPEKMASQGADWETNPQTQILWMIGYITTRYRTPVDAWAFHLQKGWY